MPADFTPRTNDAVIAQWMNARNNRTLKSVAYDDGYADL